LEAVMGSHEHELVFVTRTGKPINHANITNRMWNVVQEKAGVSRLNPHAARHFFASRLIQRGANLKELQAKLGHENPAFTLQQYGHLLPGDHERDRKLAAAMVLA